MCFLVCDLKYVDNVTATGTRVIETTSQILPGVSGREIVPGVSRSKSYLVCFIICNFRYVEDVTSRGTRVSDSTDIHITWFKGN